VLNTSAACICLINPKDTCSGKGGESRWGKKNENGYLNGCNEPQRGICGPERQTSQQQLMKAAGIIQRRGSFGGGERVVLAHARDGSRRGTVLKKPLILGSRTQADGGGVVTLLLPTAIFAVPALEAGQKEESAKNGVGQIRTQIGGQGGWIGLP